MATPKMRGGALRISGRRTFPARGIGQCKGPETGVVLDLMAGRPCGGNSASRVEKKD